MKRTSIIALVLVLWLPSPAALAKPKTRLRDGKPAVTAPQETGVNHTVERGETLFSIAEKYYGDGYQWVRLKEYNLWVDPEHLNIGETIFIPDPKRIPAGTAAGRRSFDLPGPGSLFAWVPNLGSLSMFGRSFNQLVLILLVWFVLHFTIQGLFVWFAAHLAFVKDVNLKKAMRATLQSESLALVCVVLAAAVGFMLLYVGTTSPGKPVTADLLSTAEDYLGTGTGMAVCALLLVALYGFLGIRFIPPAFGIPPTRGLAVVMIAVLVPHLIGFYLVGHRMGLLN